MASKTIRDLETQLAVREQQYEGVRLDVEALRRALAIMQEAEQQQEEEEEPPAKVIRNTMVEILRQSGEPLHYGAIFDELRSLGVVIPGKDPKRNVGAHLSIDDRFEKKGGGLWGLASWKRNDAPAQAGKPPEPSKEVFSSESESDNEDRWTVDFGEPSDEEIQRLADLERERTLEDRAEEERMQDERARLYAFNTANLTPLHPETPRPSLRERVRGSQG